MRWYATLEDLVLKHVHCVHQRSVKKWYNLYLHLESYKCPSILQYRYCVEVLEHK